MFVSTRQARFLPLHGSGIDWRDKQFLPRWKQDRFVFKRLCLIITCNWVTECKSDCISGALKYLNTLLSKSFLTLSQRKWYQEICKGLLSNSERRYLCTRICQPVSTLTILYFTLPFSWAVMVSWCQEYKITSKWFLKKTKIYMVAQRSINKAKPNLIYSCNMFYRFIGTIRMVKWMLTKVNGVFISLPTEALVPWVTFPCLLESFGENK